MSHLPRNSLQKVFPQGKEENWTRVKLEYKLEMQNTLQFMVYKGFMDTNAPTQKRMPSMFCG